MKTIYRVKSNQGRYYIDLFDDIAKALNCLRECEAKADENEKWFIKADMYEKGVRIGQEDLSDEYVKGVESALQLARVSHQDNMTRAQVAEVLASHLGDEPDHDTPADFERGLKETMKALIARYTERE